MTKLYLLLACILFLSACDKGASEHNFNDSLKTKQTNEPTSTQTPNDPHDLTAQN
ncbi:hypothetical protein [Moraxella boevrei]|uniref:hypothetical protein n=1 Tax=Faucicola boevrei TaxID=346665 RepID=UPI00373518A5